MKRGGRAAAQGAREGYRYGRERVEWAMEEQPLAVGIGALALGVLAGLAIPGTRAEDRLFGETADDMKERAEDLGRQAYDEGKRVASDVAHAASDEAKRQGLTPSQLAESATAAAREAGRAARERTGEGVSSLKEGVAKVASAAGETARKDVDELKAKSKS
jgi:hypothetical protein